MDLSTLDSFTRAYITAALWSSDDDDGTPLDKHHGPADISDKTLDKMAADCAAFQSANAGLLTAAGISSYSAGHCFWLNRNGHGSGFWDEHSQTTCDAYEREQAIAIGSRDFSKRDALNVTCLCPYHICQRLSEAAKAWGPFDLYIGDDRQTWGSPL